MEPKEKEQYGGARFCSFRSEQGQGDAIHLSWCRVETPARGSGVKRPDQVEGRSPAQSVDALRQPVLSNT